MDDDESTDIDSVSVQMERERESCLARDDSIRTEDFSKKFNATLLPSDGNGAIRSCLFSSNRHRTAVDGALDSVRTEDFLTEFGKTLIKEGSEGYPYYGTGSANISKVRLGKSSLFPLGGIDADQESIATENYETTFQRIMVRDDSTLPVRSRIGDSSANRSLSQPDGYKSQVNGRGDSRSLSAFSKPTPFKSSSRTRLSNITEGLECSRSRNRPTSPDRTEALLHSGPLIQSSARSSLSQIPFGLTPRQALDQKVGQLDELSSAVRTARSEKVRLISDLTRLEESLRRNAAEFRLNEKMTRSSRAETEDAKAELALAEMRRNRLLHSLETMNEKLASKKEQLAELELALRERLREIHSLEEVGLTREEIDEVIRERDELFELIRASDETENAKYELEKKITVLRGEAAEEQQKANQRICALQEELEECMSRISTFRMEKESLVSQVSDLERQLDEARRAVLLKDDEEHSLKSQLGHLKEDKESEIRSVSNRYQQEISRLQEVKLSIETDLVAKNEDLQRRILGLEAKFKEAEDLNEHLCSENAQLKDKLSETEEALSEAESKVVSVMEDRRRSEEDFRSRVSSQETESERSLHKLQEDMNTKRLKDIENLRCRLESAHDTELQAIQDNFRKEISLLRESCDRKTEEIDALTNLIQQKTREMELAREEHEIELRERIRDTLSREQTEWERQADHQLKTDLSALKEESDRVQESLRNKLERQREKTRYQENLLKSAKEEMDKERIRLGVIIDDQGATILKLTRELEDGTRKFEAKLQEKERVLTNRVRSEDDLRSEMERQRHVLDELSQSEGAFIGAVHEEGLRLIRSLRPGVSFSDRELPAVPSDMKGCLLFLETCVKEASTEFNQIQSRLEIEKRKLAEILATKNDTIRTLNDGKARDLEDLKDKLIENHKKELKLVQETSTRTVEQILVQKEAELRQLRQSMQEWKTTTAEQLASKLQEEFNREYDRKMRDVKRNLKRRERDLSDKRREVEKLEVELTRARSVSPSRKNHSPDPMISTSTAARTISQLQDRITSLREENIGLRKENVILRSSSVNTTELRTSQELSHGFGTPNRVRTPSIDIETGKTRSEASITSVPRSDRINGSADEFHDRLKQNSRPQSRGSLRASPAQVPVRD